MADQPQAAGGENFGALSDFASGQSGQFIKFDEENTPIEGMYTGYFIEDDPFNPGRQRVVYKIEINREEKLLTSGSKRLATAMVEKRPELGSFLRITRIPGATQYDTEFEVETSDIPF